MQLNKKLFKIIFIKLSGVHDEFSGLTWVNLIYFCFDILFKKIYQLKNIFKIKYVFFFEFF